MITDGNLLPASRLTVGAMSTPSWSLEEDLALYTELGLTTVNLSVHKFNGASNALLRSKLASAGVGVNTILLRGIGFNLRAPNTWRGTEDHLAQVIETASVLGASQCMFCGGSAHGMPGDEGAIAFAEAVAPTVRLATELGIRLLLEPVRPQFAHLGFVHSFRDGAAIVRSLGLGLVFDVVHCWWEPNLREAVARDVDLIGLVQMADLDLTSPVFERVLPGDGDLQLARTISILLGAGYEGLFEVELIGEALEREGYRHAVSRSLQYLALLEHEKS